MMRAWLLWCFAMLCVPLASAQETSPACATCKDRGMLPCKLCATRPCVSERGYAFCSAEVDCKDCGGARFRECGQCEREPELPLAKKRAELAAWRATKQPIEDYMSRREILFLDSERFRLAFDLRKLEVKGTSSVHGAAHVYLDRLERLHSDFCVDLGVEARHFSGPTQVMVWSSEKDQEKASSKWTLEKTTSLAKLMGKAPVVSLYFGKGSMRDDAALHHAVVHQVAHCLASNLYDGVWIGNLKAGWMDEGLAHLYEQRHCGGIATWCAMSEAVVEEAKLGPFEAEVLARLAAGGAPDLDALSGFDTVALSPIQRVFAWSYCDFLVRAHPGRVGPVLKLLKKEKPTSEAIQSGLGMPIVDFQLAWSTWVQATYSPKRK